ncbi:ABC transporter substrate-binding protein [Haematomicrobium sanguinis]|uniref:ABC transporter substrate-binding protein n=1 Tax=Haematomicrobium sanguinis TaxID=479106 RepID=UPI00047ABFEE|nr:sugar ABC transporter substrate-binding protein [Haematomicrobium sanguinis]
MKKFLKGIAVAAAATLALTACGNGGDSGSAETVNPADVKGEIVFQTWALTPKFQDYLDKVISGFEEKYPGTTVKLQDQPGDGYSDKIVSQASTNTLPDVINLPPDFGVALAKQGLLADVSKLDPNLDSTYVKGALDAYRYKGVEGTYGFPWYLNTDISYWNTQMLQDAGLDTSSFPKTVDEQFEWAQKMKDATGGKSYLLSSKPGLADFVRAGIDVLNEDGTEAVFNTDQAAEILQKYVDAYQNGLYPSSVLNDDYLGNSKLFTQGEVAYTTGGGPAYKSFVTDNPSLEGKIGMSAALNDTPPLYVQGISIPESSQNKATAVAFAQYLLSPENQLEFANLTNTFPSTTASADDPSLSKSDGTPEGDAKVLAFESLQKAKVLVPVEFNDAMNTIVNQQIALAMKGSIEPKAALDSAADQVNRLLKQQN